MGNTMYYFNDYDRDYVDYDMEGYDIAMEASIKWNSEERAIQEMVSRLIAIKNDKDSCEFSKTIYEKYKPLMFLTDMDPEENSIWTRNAMFDFKFLKEYESDRADEHISLLDMCLCVKQKRKAKQLERKKKKKKKENKEGD